MDYILLERINDRLRDENDKLKAEVERLRAGIASTVSCYDGQCDQFCCQIIVDDIARLLEPEANDAGDTSQGG